MTGRTDTGTFEHVEEEPWPLGPDQIQLGAPEGLPGARAGERPRLRGLWPTAEEWSFNAALTSYPIYESSHSPYSADVWSYEPRCCRCHEVSDGHMARRSFVEILADDESEGWLEEWSEEMEAAFRDFD